LSIYLESEVYCFLCTDKDQQEVEVFDLDASGIHVAEYWTELPPKEIFEQKIQDILKHSREQRLSFEKPWDLDLEDET
jgi:isocitrate dehydrogenase kinase/phosphatase